MQLQLKLEWLKAFSFATECDGWRRKCFLGGLWILLFPPLGWLLALGYRKDVAMRLIDNRGPFLPDWNQWRVYLLDGMKAAGVMLLYFLPFSFAFWAFAAGSLAVAWQHVFEIAVFCLLVPLCIPLFQPSLPLLYCYLLPWIHLETWQMLTLAVCFWSALFLLPAAFGRVCLTGSFAQALRVDSVCFLIASNGRAYLEAWCIALVATTAALCALPIAPWGIFWSYLAGSFAFNNALALSAEPHCRERFRNAAVFARLGVGE